MLTELTATQALWFLPPVLPVALWVAWSDMARMTIPNRAVLALIAVFAVTGLFALELPDYGLRWLQFAGVLTLGFLLTMAGAMGGGDAKFGAAMALFIAAGDALLFLMILCVALLAAYAAHRLARAVPLLRNLAPHWASWTDAKFPMGLALSAALLLYLAIPLL